MYIATPEELDTFCQQICHARVLAVDTEFMRESTYHPVLCLIQISDGEHIAAIDPLALHDLRPLIELLEKDTITKVFHACEQDLEALYWSLGCVCAPVFDTQIAANFLGAQSQLGLGKVVQEYCGVNLPKSETLTDWTKRPMSEQQLRYAEDDVRYLPAIYEAMMKELTREGRLSWVLAEIEHYSALDRIALNPREAYLHLKRATGLSHRQTAIARELCAWREEKAERLNIRRKQILSDEVLLELLKRPPHTASDILRIRGTRSLKNADIKDIIHAVSEGLKVPLDQVPFDHDMKKRSHTHESAVDLMSALVRVRASKYRINPNLVATRNDLRAFLVNPDHTRLASGWRYEVAGKALGDLVAGKTGLTLKHGELELI